jgi:hypothetical protein
MLLFCLFFNHYFRFLFEADTVTMVKIPYSVSVNGDGTCAMGLLRPVYKAERAKGGPLWPTGPWLALPPHRDQTRWIKTS